jgi:hypothetical protein
MLELYRRKFALLLTALLLLMVAYPILEMPLSGKLVPDILLAVLFLSSFLVVSLERRLRWPLLALGLLLVFARLASPAVVPVPRTAILLTRHLGHVLYLLLTLAVLLRTVVREKRLTPDSSCGALCGYLLIGVIFAQGYCALEVLRPTSFRDAQGPLLPGPDEDRNFFPLAYFSLISLTSLGYGDILPNNHSARALAVLEVLLGQFYMAALIGALVGKAVSQSLSQPGE